MIELLIQIFFLINCRMAYSPRFVTDDKNLCELQRQNNESDISDSEEDDEDETEINYYNNVIKFLEKNWKSYSIKITSGIMPYTAILFYKLE